MATDPFTQTLDKLWEALEGHAALAALVKAGNRIKLTGEGGDPYKPSTQYADKPELAIEPAGGSIETAATSTSARILQDFDIRLATGSLRVGRELFPVKWEIVKALAAAGQTLGLSFVRKVTVTSATDRRGDDEADRGTPGWTTVLTVRTEMWFAEADLS